MSRPLHVVPSETPHVVGYVRVSTAREEMISPELQRQAIEDYCARRGYILDEIIEDLDATGRTFAREGVQRAIERVEGAGVAVVVVWKFSRFGRNRKGWALNLGRVEDAGGRLESATEEVDASTAAGKLSRGIFAEFAAFQSDAIGEEWQSAHRNRIENGLPHSGPARFGYIYHRTTTKIRAGIRICPQGCEVGECQTGYVPDAVTGEILADLYAQYNAGQRFRALCIELNEAGTRTVRGALWGPSSLRRTLDSGFAAGLLRVHRKDCRCKSPFNCVNCDWLPGAHQPVISAETWELYRKNRTRRATYAPRTEDPGYPLSGLIVCALCDGGMHAMSRTQARAGYIRGYMYHCGRNIRAKLCTGSSVMRAEAEDRVLAWLTTISCELSAKSEQVEVHVRANALDRQAERQGLLRDQQKLAVALTRLTVQVAKDLVPEDAYEAARDEIEEESAKISRLLEALGEDGIEPPGPPVQVVRDLVVRWPLLPAPQKREMLARLLTRVTVRRIGRGDVELRAFTTWGEEVVL